MYLVRRMCSAACSMPSDYVSFVTCAVLTFFLVFISGLGYFMKSALKNKLSKLRCSCRRSLLARYAVIACTFIAVLSFVR